MIVLQTGCDDWITLQKRKLTTQRRVMFRIHINSNVNNSLHILCSQRLNCHNSLIGSVIVGFHFLRKWLVWRGNPWGSLINGVSHSNRLHSANSNTIQELIRIQPYLKDLSSVQLIILWRSAIEYNLIIKAFRLQRTDLFDLSTELQSISNPLWWKISLFLCFQFISKILFLLFLVFSF